MPIRITGLNSGLDTEAIISALVSSYNYKTNKYKKAQTKLSWKQDAWKSLNTKVYSFYTGLDSLRFSKNYNLKSTKVSDTTKATVTASSSAPNGTQKLNITQIAQAGYLTGGKLGSNVTTGTTLAELGYTSTSSGKIELTKGDGTTKTVEVSQSTTVNEFINSLKEAGVNASYDNVNKRIFVSSKETGKDNDFTLTGTDTNGTDALYALGLSVSSKATASQYQAYAQYKTSDGKTVEDNITSALNSYKAAQSANTTLTAQNANMTGAYGYASAYTSMQGLLAKTGVDTSKLTALLGMSESERASSLMDSNGNVYKEAGTDEDGNTIYSYNNGTSTSYIQKIVSYKDESGNAYTKNDDGTLTKGSVVYTATGETKDGKAEYKTEDGTSVYIETETNYNSVTMSLEDTGHSKYTDSNNVTYTQNDTGTYAGSDGNTYRLDAANKTMIQVDSEGKDVSGGKSATVGDAEKITKAKYTKVAENTGIKTAADVLSDLKADTNYNLTEEEETTLASNATTVNQYEAKTDTLDSSDVYSVASITAKIKDLYQNGGADKVSEYTSTFAEKLSDNTTKINKNNELIDGHQELAELAAIDTTTSEGQTAYTEALNSFKKQVETASSYFDVNGNLTIKTNSDANKIDGQDAIIKLNDVEYTGSSNSFSINGLNITAQVVTGDGDSNAISITTSTDTQGIYDKIKDFFSQYNSLINEITSLYNADSAKGYDPLTDDEKDAMSDTEVEKWEQKIKDSLLRRDDNLESLMSAMTSAMSGAVEIDGKKYYLSNFGIKTLGYLNAPANQQNAYHIDGDEDDANSSGNEDKLMAAITNDPDTVISFMQGLAENLYDSIHKKMQSSSLSSIYTVYNDKEMASEYSDYTSLIKKWEEKLEDKEDYYYKKFSSMETALSKLNSQTSSLSGLFGS